MNVRLILVLTALLAVAGCGDGDEPSLSVQGSPEDAPVSVEPSRPVNDPSEGVSVSVTLWHCGVEPVTVEGRVWKVPDTETVDGHPDAPLDSTNTPADWVGSGTAVVAEDEMTYTDEGGEVVRFVPDDGRAPEPCG